MYSGFFMLALNLYLFLENSIFYRFFDRTCVIPERIKHSLCENESDQKPVIEDIILPIAL
jgi:hypothetical protein